MTPPPIKKPQIVEPQLCECGDHAWAHLSRGRITLVSAADAPLLRHKWHAHSSAPRLIYAFRTIHMVGSGRETAVRVAEYLHRRICPDAERVDHINHDTLDNRRQNLRAATASTNGANRLIKKASNASSRYRGVSWRADRGKWVAQIAGRHLGRYVSEETAARAYDRSAAAVYGDFAVLNFPPEECDE